MPPCKNSKIFIAKNNKGELQIIGILITIVNKPNQNSNHFLITIVLCNENLKILDFFFNFGIFQTVFWPGSRLYFGLKIFYDFL